jgi:hypothetical protein
MIAMNEFMLGCEEGEQECEQSERRTAGVGKRPKVT